MLPLPLLPAVIRNSRVVQADWVGGILDVAGGVRVLVQVMPPSLELRLDKLPLATVKSPVVKPVTASLKVSVTVAVSPILKGAITHRNARHRRRFGIDSVIATVGGARAGIAKRVRNRCCRGLPGWRHLQYLCRG